MNELNDSIHDSGLPNVWVTASLVVQGVPGMALRFAPTSLRCAGSRISACTNTYAENRNDIRLNSYINQMKKDYDTDITILLRELKSDSNNPNSLTTGQANMTTTTKLSNASYAIAVAQFVMGWSTAPANNLFINETTIHEIGHLLGADHSRHNFQHSGNKRQGYGDAFWHTTNCPTQHYHGVRTIMTYHEVCENANRKLWPSSCGNYPGCEAVKRFSNTRKYTTVFNQSILVGTSTIDNIHHMEFYAPYIAAYSDYIK